MTAARSTVYPMITPVDLCSPRRSGGTRSVAMCDFAWAPLGEKTQSVTVLDEVRHPVVLAPLAGGPSTPELTATVADAGAFAFLAGGYLTSQELRDRLRAVRSLTARPIGVNLFAPGRPADPKAVAKYAGLLRSEADHFGISLGDPRFDDDGWGEKLELLVEEPVEVVSFTFGCPPSEVIQRLRAC